VQFYDTPGLTYDSGAVFDDATNLPKITGRIMARVKFSFKDMSDTEAIQACLNLKTALTGNVNFPTPPVLPPALGTKITSAQAKLTAADNAQAASKQATADKDAEMDVLKAMAMQDIGYVDLTANGNESMILSAGLPVRSAKTPQSVPNQVMNLSLTTGDNDGSLDAHWDSQNNISTFEVQGSPDPFTSTSFVTLDTVTKSSTTLPGLPSGSRHWVRVRGVNSAGKGPWSDPAVKTVP
jgi:hypothetical protein